MLAPEQRCSTREQGSFREEPSTRRTFCVRVFPSLVLQICKIPGATQRQGIPSFVYMVEYLLSTFKFEAAHPTRRATGRLSDGFTPSLRDTSGGWNWLPAFRALDFSLCNSSSVKPEATVPVLQLLGSSWRPLRALLNTNCFCISACRTPPSVTKSNSHDTYANRYWNWTT